MTKPVVIDVKNKLTKSKNTSTTLNDDVVSKAVTDVETTQPNNNPFHPLADDDNTTDTKNQFDQKWKLKVIL